MLVTLKALKFLALLKCRLLFLLITMSHRAPSRMYNPLALEAWFTFSQYDWEQNFSDSSLQQGRTLYRQGKITGIELTPHQAIIHSMNAKSRLV